MTKHVHVLQLQTCVSTSKSMMSQLFNSKVGTMQGCILSLFLFVFYINGLIRECKELLGLQINGNIDINMFLYADVPVIVGDNAGRVQRILNKLSEFCHKWGLAVNAEKTESMVFRNGSIIKNVERFYFDGNAIENVTHYKYLGLLISTRLSWSPCKTSK